MTMTKMLYRSKDSARADRSAGFSYVEVLLASTLLALALLAMCGMFVAGYANVTGSGRATMGLSASRQLMEDLRRLPYDDLINLDGFDTDDPTTLPAAGAEREVARRWRYALAGEGVGWNFTDDEQSRWTDLAAQGQPLGANGTVSVVQQSATLTEVTIEVAVPGLWRQVRVSTLITRI